MAQPSLGDVHVDGPLTDMATAYFQRPGAFAWNRVFPLIASPKQSNKYFIYNKADLLRSDAKKRAPGTAAATRTHTLSTGTFFCDRYAIAEMVPRDIEVNADAPLSPEEDAVRVLVQDLNIAFDVQFAAEAFAGSLWGTTVTGATNFTQWDDDASSPVKDVATGIKTVLKNTGFRPNTLVLGAATWYDGLMNHPDIIARLPDNAPRLVTEQFLGTLFDLDRVVIAEGIRNTAQEGLSGSYSFNLGSHALLAYVDPNPGPRTPTAGATFNWTGLTGAGDGIRVKRIDDPVHDGTLVEVEAAVDFKIVGSDLGYFFSTAVSTS